MMRIRLKKYLLIVASLLLVYCASNSASYGQNQAGSSKVKEIRTDNGARIFIKDGGWSIPDSGLVISKSFSSKIRAQGGRKVKLKGKIYQFATEIVSDEPLRTIVFSTPTIRFTKLYEHRIKGSIFCYKLLFSYKSMGVDDFLTVYDEDGDGVFESLVLGETVNGLYSSSNFPHIPPWLLTNKSKNN